MSKMYVKETRKMVLRDWGEEKGKEINDYAEENLERLIRENPDDPKALISHSHGQIYPLVAYELALENVAHLSKEDAYDWLMTGMMDMCEDMTKPIKKLMRLGLWRTVPTLFNKVTPKMYGPDAGFEAESIISTKERSKFNMTKCPYYDTFKRLGYPELCRICCASDDATYGYLHENVKWNRSKTLARGGDCCDFDIYLERPEKK